MVNRRSALKGLAAGASVLALPHRARAIVGMLRGAQAPSTALASKVVGTSGGTPGYDYSGLPPYQNGMKVARGFMTTADITQFTSLDSNGWPTTDFQTYLLEMAAYSPIPSWCHVNDSANPWKCGYTSKNGGAETITGVSATISNIVKNGNTVTFDLVPTASDSGFKITGTTGGVTNVFANLPEYPTASGMFTNEFINELKNFGCQRALAWGNVLWCAETVTSTNRHTPSNMHTRMWSETSFTTTYGGVGSPTPDGYPFEDFVTLCNETNADLWWNIPLYADSTYWSAVATYALSNLNGILALELGNELWNGVGIGGMGPSSNGLGSYNSVVANYILSNPGKLDYDTACTFTGTANGTNTITGTIPTTASSGHVIVGPSVPAGTTITAVTTGAGGSITCSNSIPSGSGTFAFETYNNRYRYLAEQTYQIAQTVKGVYGASFSSKVKMIYAWQQGVAAFGEAMAYYAHTYPGTQVNSFLGALSSAPYETRNNTNVPGDGVNHVNETGDSIATILSQLTANGNYSAFNGYIENGAVCAMHYGLEFWPYEVGWETANETAAANIGPAIMDSGMTSVVESYLNNLFNSGVSRVNWTTPGVSQTGNGSGYDPGYALATSYSTFESSGSPRLAGIQSINSGITYSRSVVSGSGSVIDCINYADNVSAKSATYPYLGQVSSFAQALYYAVGGYIGYIVNCTSPGTYTVVGTFNTTATGTTNFEWGNPQSPATITTGISIPNGTGVTVNLGTVTLVEGPNYIVLGNGTTQSAIVPKSLKFN